VISKAVLYGSLAVFITAVYAGLVVGVGTLAGRDNPLLAVLAAVVVAVAFQPARQWAGLANRIVYGRRPSPYQVLSDFAQRIGSAYSHEDVLPQMAQIAGAGTGAEQVVVWLRVDDQLHPVASSGGSPHAVPPPANGLPVDGQAMPALPGADMGVPVVHGGDLLGAISIRMPKGEPLRPAGQQLVADVAVSDDGTGYDARHIPMGSGQRNMADRLAALGGWLEVRPAPRPGHHHHRAPPRPGHQRRSCARQSPIASAAAPPQRPLGWGWCFRDSG
jgi:hypothetical protein